MATRTPFRRHSLPNTSDIEDCMYTPPLKFTSFEELLLAPRKKKPVIMTRRRSAPASFLDFRDIRKKLDFEPSYNAKRFTITRGKRKYSPDSSSETHRNDMTRAFNDLTITPKSSKRVKFLVEVKNNEYESDDLQQPSSSKAPQCIYLKTSPLNLNHTDEDSEDITPESGSHSYSSRRKKSAKRSGNLQACKINRRIEVDFSDYLGDSESSHLST